MFISSCPDPDPASSLSMRTSGQQQIQRWKNIYGGQEQEEEEGGGVVTMKRERRMCVQTQTQAQVSLDLLAAQTAEGLTAWHAQPAALYNMCCSCSTVGRRKLLVRSTGVSRSKGHRCLLATKALEVGSVASFDWIFHLMWRWILRWSLVSWIHFPFRAAVRKATGFGYPFAHSQTDAEARVLSRDETAWCEKSTQCLQHINQEREHG